MLTETNVC